MLAGLDAAEGEEVGVEGLATIGAFEDDGVEEGAGVDPRGVVGDGGEPGVIVHAGAVGAVNALERAREAVDAVAAAEAVDVEGGFGERRSRHRGSGRGCGGEAVSHGGPFGRTSADGGAALAWREGRFLLMTLPKTPGCFDRRARSGSAEGVAGRALLAPAPQRFGRE